MNTMYQALNTLYRHAHEQMTPDELDQVSNHLQGDAVSMAQNMSTLLEGAACLVMADADSKQHGRIASGSLQTPESIYQVMCLAAQHFDLIAGLIEVADEAAFTAGKKRKDGAQP